MSTLTTDQLRELTKKLASNPDEIYNLTDDELMSVKQHLNPFGNVVTGKKSYINLSIINWKEEYMKKLHMTNMIGFVYRLAAEYECEKDVAVANEAFNKRVALITDANEAASLRREHEKYVDLIQSTTRKIIKDFLDRHFEYNPDHHVMNASAKGRIQKVRNTEMDDKLRSNPKVYDYMRQNLLCGQSLLDQSIEALKSSLAVMGGLLDGRESVTLDDLADAHGILQKKYSSCVALSTDMKRVTKPLVEADTVEAWNVDPPVDVFHHYTRYLTNHYEELRNICAEYYNEQPDIEYSVIYYDHFSSPEDAREYKIQHESEFKQEVMTIENSGITLVGPFKENRERIDFYNKNTEILKRMSEQADRDQKLGKDLMDKRLQKQKKKNIAELGPDDPKLASYAKSGNVVKNQGVKKAMTIEEQQEYYKKLREKDDAETPDDAIQVRMFFPKEVDGKTVLDDTVFYTQTEAPLHLQDGSEFADKYQPVRSESLDKSLCEQTVVNRHGQKCSIKTLKNNGKK
jgi:hypothetical protein